LLETSGNPLPTFPEEAPRVGLELGLPGLEVGPIVLGLPLGDPGLTVGTSEGDVLVGRELGLPGLVVGISVVGTPLGEPGLTV
jgi:hypothetical protein